MDFTKDSNSELLLSCLLQSYNLFHVVNFPPGLNSTSCSIIDNSRVSLFKVLPAVLMVSQTMMLNIGF
jgi:hypothetical protein